MARGYYLALKYKDRNLKIFKNMKLLGLTKHICKRTLLAVVITTSFCCFNADAATKDHLVEKSQFGPKNIAPKIDITSGFADIVEKLLPAVINISTIQEGSSLNNPNHPLNELLPKNQMLEDFKEAVEGEQSNQKKKILSLGSGFVISKDGYIVTNFHVIDEAKEINILFSDGSKYKARLIGIDKRTDLALLKISAVKDLKFVDFGDSARSRIGDWIIAIGNPFGFGESVSVGIISAISRDVSSNQSEGFLQTDAAINQGNSGGPMFNLKGEVIGVNTAIYSPSGNSVGIGFAIPSIIVSAIIKQLKEQGEVSRAWLGLSVQDINSEMAESFKIDQKGVFVTEVAEDGPAKKAGIMPADIIIKFDDQEINDMKELPRIVAKTPINKLVKITLIRQNKLKIFTVKLAKLKELDSKRVENKASNNQPSNPRFKIQMFGMSLAELNDQGLLIMDVAPKSVAANKLILANDIILSVNQIPVNSIEEFKRLIDKSKKTTNKITIFIKRANNNLAIILPIN